MFCHYFKLDKYLNRIAICVAVLLLSVPVFGQDDWDPRKIARGENPTTVNQAENPTIIKSAENTTLTKPYSEKYPNSNQYKNQGDNSSNGVTEEDWDPRKVLGKKGGSKIIENNEENNTSLFFILVAGVAITLALIIVIPRLFSKCPRCGKILHGGNCSACFWPKPRCELCQSSPLFDDVCPNCGAHPDGFPNIRYNDSSDSQGRKTGGFGIVYSAIVKDGDGYSEGYMLKRSRTYNEMHDRLLRDDEFNARRDGITFEANVLSYLKKNSFEGAPKIIARGDELNSAKGLGPWYLMEKARGDRMDAWMKAQQGDFSPNNQEGLLIGQKRLLIGLAKSLLGLHKLGVCHRDFKPENVFWDEKRQIATIIDYGSAAMPQGEGSTENPIEHKGAPVSRFWAPQEQFHSKLSDNDETADIFSFGVIFCAVVLGKEHLDRSNPIAIESYKERISAIVGTPITNLLFNRLLASDRENRRNSLSEFVELLSKEWGY